MYALIGLLIGITCVIVDKALDRLLECHREQPDKAYLKRLFGRSAGGGHGEARHDDQIA